MNFNLQVTSRAEIKITIFAKAKWHWLILKYQYQAYCTKQMAAT